MISPAVRPLATIALVLALASCQGVPADYKPDPKMKTESVAALKSRVVKACVVTQRAKASLSTPELQKSCGCYAGKTFGAMSKEEVSFYRENGYFNDSARNKGETALTACKLSL